MYIKKLYIKKQAETAFNVILNNHRKMGRCYKPKRNTNLTGISNNIVTTLTTMPNLQRN